MIVVTWREPPDKVAVRWKGPGRLTTLVAPAQNFNTKIALVMGPPGPRGERGESGITGSIPEVLDGGNF